MHSTTSVNKFETRKLLLVSLSQLDAMGLKSSKTFTKFKNLYIKKTLEENKYRYY